MTRKEERTKDGRSVCYFVGDDINVSAVISELSAMGCKGAELGRAYKKLISDDRTYVYDNKAGCRLAVIDERTLHRSPMVSFAWMFFALCMGGSDFLSDMVAGEILGELKKGGEEV